MYDSILASDEIHLTYTKKTPPYRANFGDPLIKTSDMDTYGCFAVTLNDVFRSQVPVTMDIPGKIFHIVCAAFIGQVTVHGVLYHATMCKQIVQIILLANVQ